MRTLWLICCVWLLQSCAVHVDEKLLLPSVDSRPLNLKMLQRQSDTIVTPMQVITMEQLKFTGIKITYPNPKATILFFGGNQSTSSSKFWSLVEDAEALGVNIIMIDRRGYGGSDGSPSFARLRLDALAVFDSVQTQLKSPLIVHGHSIGSFEAVAVAKERTIQGLILEAPATYAEEWVEEYVPWYYRLFMNISYGNALAEYNNTNDIAKVKVPTVIFVGQHDTSTPPTLAKSLYSHSSAQHKKLHILPEQSHNDIRLAKEYYPLLRQFLLQANN
jgi:pimeloyl-ACP methyl ester carboxylesterase